MFIRICAFTLDLICSFLISRIALITLSLIINPIPAAVISPLLASLPFTDNMNSLLSRHLIRTSRLASVRPSVGSTSTTNQTSHYHATPSLTSPDWHGTTIVCVRKNGRVCMMGDGMVSMGNTLVKPNARKIYVISYPRRATLPRWRERRKKMRTRGPLLDSPGLHRMSSPYLKGWRIFAYTCFIVIGCNSNEYRYYTNSIVL